MRLSIVIPVFNGATFVRARLEELHAYLLRHYGADFEVIVVDDGSGDGTPDLLRSLRLPQLKVIALATNQGKFAAIRQGMAHASGRCRFFTDADVPYEFEAIPYMADLIERRGFHVVIGDRTLPGAEYAVHMDWMRAIATRVFTACVRILVTGGLFDTQCGLKGFRGDVAEGLFTMLRDEGFSGDVELLYLALKYNLEIKRVPVRLRHNAPSTVRVMAHGLAMLRRISLLRLHWSRGRYASPSLRELARQDYWADGSPDVQIQPCPNQAAQSKR